MPAQQESGRELSAAAIFRNPIHLAAFGFGSGLAPTAPGTAGTVVGVGFYLAMMSLELQWYLLLTALLMVLGIWLCHVTARDLGVHDHPGIVWDEIVGYLITMIAVPRGAGWIVAGFVLFRFFDILKPWPIRWIDRRVGGGFGIMLDDVLAGLFALAILQGSVWYLLK